ncbi:MAG TPA: hypothetical protein ENO17_07550 [Candidatus Atribacteria bacterium]|nr:hypothetical protein [Candidatus Atribacteria bacterium]
MKASKLIKGLTFLLIGIILLANTLQILDWSVWSNLFKLWPLLVISLGWSLIFRGKGLSFIGPLIIFLGIVVGVGASYMGINFEGEVVRETKTLSRGIAIEIEKIPETETAPDTEVAPDTDKTPETETALETKEYSEIEKASIGLNFDVGKLTLGKSTPLLYECISQYRYKEFEPLEKFSQTGKESDILIYHSPTTHLKRGSNNIKNEWQLKLNDQIIYELYIKTSAIDTDCNLSGFNIEKLTIESGASNVKLIIPQYNSAIMIDSGVSNIDISLPKNVGATVNIDSGIGVKDLNANYFTKKNGRYISNNYDISEFKTEIEIDCGVSNIEVSYIDIP